jgi:hypothetical protein
MHEEQHGFGSRPVSRHYLSYRLGSLRKAMKKLSIICHQVQFEPDKTVIDASSYLQEVRKVKT